MTLLEQTQSELNRLLLAYQDAIASKGKHAGKLKAKCPPMGTDGAIMWQAIQLNANPYKVSIWQIAMLSREQSEFYALCQAWADARKAIAPMLDRDRVALERLGAW
jgi:hypothetical protein